MLSYEEYTCINIRLSKCNKIQLGVACMSDIPITICRQSHVLNINNPAYPDLTQFPHSKNLYTLLMTLQMYPKYHHVQPYYSVYR